MRKLLSYILCLHFLVISLLPNSEVMELFKLNNLLSHFTHHQVVHKENINFVEFLVLHYLDQKHLYNDCQEHSDLPFQHTGHKTTTTLNFIFTSPALFSWNFKVNDILMLDKHKSIYQENYLPSFHLSIWQPPRCA